MVWSGETSIGIGGKALIRRQKMGNTSVKCTYGDDLPIFFLPERMGVFSMVEYFWLEMKNTANQVRNCTSDRRGGGILTSVLSLSFRWGKVDR